jgi:hypothetical protein
MILFNNQFFNRIVSKEFITLKCVILTYFDEFILLNFYWYLGVLMQLPGGCTLDLWHKRANILLLNYNCCTCRGIATRIFSIKGQMHDIVLRYHIMNLGKFYYNLLKTLNHGKL